MGGHSTRLSSSVLVSVCVCVQLEGRFQFVTLLSPMPWVGKKVRLLPALLLYCC